MEMDYIPSFVPHVIVKKNRRSVYVSLQKRTDPKLLSSERSHDTERIFDGYASPETKAIGDRLIDREVLNVPNEKARAVVLENLKLIEQDNRRDFRF